MAKVFVCTIVLLYLSSKIDCFSKNVPAVFVGGASNKVGINVVRLLSMKNRLVHVVARQSSCINILKTIPGVTVHMGNITDPIVVHAAMRDCNSVITCVRGISFKGERVEYGGNSNVIDQASKLGIDRIILLTSIGCGDTKSAISPKEYLDSFARINELNKAEIDLKSHHDISWTIIRRHDTRRPWRGCPVPTRKGVLTENVLANGPINEIDTAYLIADLFEAPSSISQHKELSAVDSSFSYDTAPVSYVPFLLH